jgi:magnesium transporter
MAHDTAAASAVTTLIGDFIRLYPGEAARAIERLPPAGIARQLASMPVAHAAAVMERLTPEPAANTLQELSGDRAQRVLATMDPARAVPILAWLDEPARERVLASAGEGVARELLALAEYPPDSAGRLMDPRVTALPDDATVATALARLRAARRTVHDVYLLDADGHLAGAVAVQDIAVSPPAEPLARLTRRPAVEVPALATREDVMERLSGGRVTSLPVVDAHNRLVGVIRPEALMTVAQEEAGADMQAMVGASREERALSKVSFAVRKRLPWLHINLATAFLAAAVVGLFEDTIAKFTALAVLLPVVAGQSGNTGAQALAVTMRGLALREVRVRHWLRIAIKESNVALINGCAVALTTSAGVYVWSQSVGLTLVIGMAMVISMLAAGLAGAVIPMVLTASGQDPAQSSSIILTTVTDVVGFLSFLGIATALSGML